jgi:hypothetical protein
MESFSLLEALSFRILGTECPSFISSEYVAETHGAANESLDIAG